MSDDGEPIDSYIELPEDYVEVTEEWLLHALQDTLASKNAEITALKSALKAEREISKSALDRLSAAQNDLERSRIPL